MSSVDQAIFLGRQGFRVFPLIANSKIPAIVRFPERASNRQQDIEKFWAPDPFLNLPPDYNIGISTSFFGEDKSLVVVDVDNKDGRNGFETLKYLDALGSEMPPTLSQITPTGGMHLVYWNEFPVKQGANVLGVGLDIRSKGGYIVGHGSELNGKQYLFNNALPVAKCPTWIIEKCGFPHEKEIHNQKAQATNQDAAMRRATEYLDKLKPVRAGSRNDTGYKVACVLKDMGIAIENISHLLETKWKCEPPLDINEILAICNSAFQFGNREPGVSAPENVFDAVSIEKKKSPIEIFNDKYFVVLSGGSPKVCWETTNVDGHFRLEQLSPNAFHEWTLNETMAIGDGRNMPISKMWIRSPMVRKFDGFIFEPNAKPNSKFYNLWKGFAVKPLDPDIAPTQKAQAAFDLFLEHCFQNICGGDIELGKWLMGYFAHIFQKPEEKPGVALVFKGKKGVGKNALIDRISYLIGDGAVTVADRRYLLGNFNSVLENKILYTLDEAFWSGDKQSEGVLKALITSETKMIERKGSEPYLIKSVERVAILGNEDWLAPATSDERRFAVFNVGDKRRQDFEFFAQMKKGMEKEGGAELLLRRLLDFDLSTVNVRIAPQTQGLLEQKENSLTPFQRWWHDCLKEGFIVGSIGEETWPQEITCATFRAAFLRYSEESNIYGRQPSAAAIARELASLSPSSVPSIVKREGTLVNRIYVLSPLEKARKEWEDHFGKGWIWER